MATVDSRALKPVPAGINDDIGEETRLELYRSQVLLREAEQRAFDLFLQNLVKGTSHLSLGQEAVAAGFATAMQPGDLSFCTYRGHAHTLARGVPVEKVLGELMQRDNGLMRGKGGSMHLTSAEHGVMGSYAIIGAHLPIACGAAQGRHGRDGFGGHRVKLSLPPRRRRRCLGSRALSSQNLGTGRPPRTPISNHYRGLLRQAMPPPARVALASPQALRSGRPNGIHPI